jgi:hypothetical protein
VFLAAAAVLVVLAVASAWFVHARGYTLYYGDAEAHLNIARRITDSRTPGPEQLGTVWLPLPHALMTPLAQSDSWWRIGHAGTLVGMTAYIVSGLFLFGAARRALASNAAGFVALLVFGLNPNVLYLQATPMTEPLVFAALAGLLCTTVAYGQTLSVAWLLAAAFFANVGALVRYEGWFVLPFVAGYVLLRSRSLRDTVLFCLLAAIAPLAWLAHNLWYYSNPLEFYNGEWSAMAIYRRALAGGMARYPGDHDWPQALLYFTTAARHCAGWTVAVLGLFGVLALLRRAWWPAVFLALPPAFYVMSLYSSGTPIYVPDLWPNTHYNTRYGLAALPLLAFGAAALVAIAPARWRAGTAAAIGLVALIPWLASPRMDSVITWKESERNSEARRRWTADAADFLRSQYRPGDGAIASFGDLTGIFRKAGIPLRETLHEGNGPAWYGAIARPDLLLFERWAVAMSGDTVSTALLRTRRAGPKYECVRIISFPNSPVIEIYRRDDYPLHQGSRSEERLPAHVGR